MGFIMLFVTFSLICCTVSAERIITTETGYKIYDPDLLNILKDVTPFCLGSINENHLLYDYGLFLAEKTKKNDAEACIIGYSDVLDFFNSHEGTYEEMIAPFFSTSPYKSAQIVENIANGLLAGGIFPVLSAKYGINELYIENLKLRQIFPAIFTDKKNYDAFLLSNLDLPVVDDFAGNSYNLNLLKKMEWKWTAQLKEEKDLRKEILLNAIIELKNQVLLPEYEMFTKPLDDLINDKTVIFIDDPRMIDLSKFKTGFLIHSDDDFVLERVRLICKGIFIARGRKNW